MNNSMNDRFNDYIEQQERAKGQSLDTKETGTGDTTTEVVSTLGSGIKPSEFLPIRTARFWADVEAGKDIEFNFYKALENGGYEIHNNATKGFSKYVDSSALQQVIRETAFELSLKGESDIAVFLQNNLVVPLKIALVDKQYMPNGDLRYYQGIVNFDTGTAPWIMTKKFYLNSKNEVIMENQPYETRFKDGVREWAPLSIKSFNKKYKLDLADKINLGVIPFPVITMTNTGADRWGSGTSDTAEVQDVLAKLDTIEDAIDRAIKTAKTKLFNKRRNGSMDLGGDTANSVTKQILDDVEVVDYVTDPHQEGDTGTLIVDRNLNVDAWYMLRKNYMNEYFSHTGENVAADAHGNNQHTYEVQSKGDNKFRRGTSKMTQRRKELKVLADIIIALAKSRGANDFAGLDSISININEVDIRKEFELEEKVEKYLNLGLMSKVQALMKLESIDEQTAMIMLAAGERHGKLFKEEEPEVPVQEEQPEVSNEEATETVEDKPKKKGLFRRG